MKKEPYIFLNKNEYIKKYSFVKNEIDPFEAGIPLIDISDKTICQIYYFRWHTFCKHIRKVPCGYVVTEFFDNVPWAGKYNTISCPAHHHINEGRWLYEPKYVDSYIRFWMTEEAEPRRYSFPVAAAVYAFCNLTGDFSLCSDIYENLKENYACWENEKQMENGLFYQSDNRDGMEYSISGSGLRPTINSYMYGDSLALSRMAKRFEKHDEAELYQKKADRIKKLVDEMLWDDKACFYKNLSENSGFVKADVREEIGYIPWCYGLPDGDKAVAWKFLMDEEYFAAPRGITTAERNHPGFMKSFDHECLWNGPSWPFATSQTLTALSNHLTNYDQSIMNRKDFYQLLKQYAEQHYITENGEKIPFIDEDLDPFTGEWIARRELLEMKDPPGGADRGRDYNHSTFCDLVLSGLAGIRPRDDDLIEIDPLFSEDDIDYFCSDGIKYRGRFITVLWDRSGKRYGRKNGLTIYVDGIEKAHSADIEKIIIK